MEKKQQAVLVVSFGTSVNETREKTLDRIEDGIGKAFPEYALYRAWTSGRIIAKLWERDGAKIMTVEEALEAMKRDGITRLIVQPTHMLPGIEYEEMVAAVQKREKDFEAVSFGKPLLADREDCRRAVKAVMGEIPAPGEEEALIFMGHGTPHRANAAYEAVKEALESLGYSRVYLGTVEASPAFSEVLQCVKEQKAKKVWLAPFMVVAGDHALNDMAGEEEDSWKSQAQKAGFSVGCILRGLGEYEEIRKLYTEHVKAAEEGL